MVAPGKTQQEIRPPAANGGRYGRDIIDLYLAALAKRLKPRSYLGVERHLPLTPSRCTTCRSIRCRGATLLIC